MDFSAILTSLWGKISKPLPNILVGSVLIIIAPEGIAWAGYIFIAIGLASAIEWFWPKICDFLRFRKLKDKIRKLPKTEFMVLNRLRINGHESLGSASIQREGLETFGTLMSLEAKKLVTQTTWSNYGGSGYSFYLPNDVELALKDIIEKDIGSQQ